MESIWYKDPVAVFAHPNRLIFVPTSHMGVSSQLNALLRLSIYFSVIMILLTRSVWYGMVPFGAALLTAGISASYTKADGFCIKPCTPPTRSNPYMNFMHTADPTTRPPACDLWKGGDLSDAQAGRVVHDHINDRSFDRFYTMPVSAVPNDQKSYMESLYGDMAPKRVTF